MGRCGEGLSWPPPADETRLAGNKGEMRRIADPLVLLIGFAVAVITVAALRLFRVGASSTEISGATFLMGFGLKHLPGTSSDSADRNPV